MKTRSIQQPQHMATMSLRQHGSLREPFLSKLSKLLQTERSQAHTKITSTKKKQVHGRSSSATTGSRRTFSRKEISDATQSLKEIMRQATVPALPDNQIIQAAVNYMKLLI